MGFALCFSVEPGHRFAMSGLVQRPEDAEPLCHHG
jgi:hypothetical protein